MWRSETFRVASCMIAGCLIAASASAADYLDPDQRDDVAIAEAVVRHEIATGALSVSATSALHLSVAGRSVVEELTPRLGDLHLHFSDTAESCAWRIGFDIQQAAAGTATVAFFAGTCGDGPQGSMMYATVQRLPGGWTVTEQHAGISF